MKGVPQESRKAPARAKGRKAKAGGGELVKSPAERVASPPYHETRHNIRFHIQGPSSTSEGGPKTSKGDHEMTSYTFTPSPKLQRLLDCYEEAFEKRRHLSATFR